MLPKISRKARTKPLAKIKSPPAKLSKMPRKAFKKLSRKLTKKKLKDSDNKQKKLATLPTKLLKSIPMPPPLFAKLKTTRKKEPTKEQLPNKPERLKRKSNELSNEQSPA
jgi:uncharacterized protein (DUF927 family)